MFFMMSSYGAALFDSNSKCAALFTACPTRSLLSRLFRLRVGSGRDCLILLVRIILASFVKDATIAAWIPSMHATVVNAKIGERIKRETFADTWVKADEVEPNRSPTLFAYLGKTVIFAGRKIVKWAQFLFLSGVGTAQAFGCLFIHTISGTAYFGARSLVLSVFSLLLLICNCIQVSQTVRLLFVNLQTQDRATNSTFHLSPLLRNWSGHCEPFDK